MEPAEERSIEYKGNLTKLTCKYDKKNLQNYYFKTLSSPLQYSYNFVVATIEPKLARWK